MCVEGKALACLCDQAGCVCVRELTHHWHSSFANNWIRLFRFAQSAAVICRHSAFLRTSNYGFWVSQNNSNSINSWQLCIWAFTHTLTYVWLVIKLVHFPTEVDVSSELLNRNSPLVQWLTWKVFEWIQIFNQFLTDNKNVFFLNDQSLIHNGYDIGQACLTKRYQYNYYFICPKGYCYCQIWPKILSTTFLTANKLGITCNVYLRNIQHVNIDSRLMIYNIFDFW